MDYSYIIRLLKQYLKSIGIKVSDKDVSFIHDSDPHATSVFSIIQTLRYFKADVEAVKTDVNTISQKQDKPIILHLNIGEGVFVLLKSVTSEKVLVYNFQDKKHVRFLHKQFMNLWSGIAVLGKKNNAAAKINLIPYLKLLLFATTILTVFSYSFSTNPALIIVLLVNCMGIFLSINAFLIKSNWANRFANNFCDLLPGKSCKTVIGNEFRLLGFNLDLTLISLFYFIFNIVYVLLFSSTSSNALAMLTILGLLGSPIIIGALYFQVFKLRTLCTICLSVILVYVLNAIYGILASQSSFTFEIFNIKTSLSIASSSGISILIVWSIYSVFKLRMRLQRTLLSEQTIKRNPIVRETVFLSSKELTIENNVLQFGNPDSKFKLTSILSLHCKYCAETALNLTKVVASYADKVEWKISLYCDNMQKGENLQETLTLITMCNQYPTEKCEIIKKWYRTKDINRLNRSYPISGMDTTAENKLLQCVKEIEQKGISQIPQTLINGRIYPNTYNLNQDLELLLLDLTEA